MLARVCWAGGRMSLAAMLAPGCPGAVKTFPGEIPRRGTFWGPDTRARSSRGLARDACARAATSSTRVAATAGGASCLLYSR